MTCYSRSSSSTGRPACSAVTTALAGPALPTGFTPPAPLGLPGLRLLHRGLGIAGHVELHRVEDSGQHARGPLQQLEHAPPQLGLQQSTCLHHTHTLIFRQSVYLQRHMRNSCCYIMGTGIAPQHLSAPHTRSTCGKQPVCLCTRGTPAAKARHGT